MRVKAHEQNRKIYKMSDFRGVDYSSSPLEVKPYRATDMANLILKDGVLHKRNGWEQVYRLFSDEYTKILGVWKGLSDTEMICHIVHRGITFSDRYRSFYSVNMSNGIKTELYRIQLSASEITPWWKEEKRCGSAFFCNDKMYILCGGYFVYGTLKNSDGTESVQFKEVTNDRYNTHIPTTTINILADGSTLEHKYPNQSKDHINLLTGWRKNHLLGEVGEDTLAYYLDADQISGSSLRAPIVEVVTEDGTSTIYDDFEYQSNTITGFTDGWWSSSSGDLTIKDGKLFPCSLVVPTEISKGWEKAEITVTFYALGTGVAENPVQECFIGTVFGVDGANDRIFIAGSEANPNVVFYSENSNEGFQPDPTYFPANYQLVCGSTDTPISALLRVSDGTLAVFKDVKQTADVGTYYISGSYQSLGEGEEGNEYEQAVFHVTAGGIKQKGVSAEAVANLEGDPLFASKDGVFGIQLSSNVASGERYAKERSRTINAKLTQFDLSLAKAIVYKGKYYLSVGGELDEVYVADARYKYTLNGDAADGFNYEWFRWTNVPAALWFEYYDQLYFISKDGWICRMTDGYADVYLASSDDNSLTVGTKTDGTGYYVAFNEELLSIVQQAEYAMDQNGAYWEIVNLNDTDTTDEVEFDSFDVPSDISVEEGQDITLRFYLPINAHWRSAILDLDGSMYRKNLWSLSTTAMPTERGFLKVGYKTRYNEQMKDRTNKQIEGAYVFSFDDIDFSMFNFDCGGFVNAFRQRVFERGFIYIQLAFASDSVGDCVVTEMALEYSPTIKNMGVG